MRNGSRPVRTNSPTRDEGWAVRALRVVAGLLSVAISLGLAVFTITILITSVREDWSGMGPIVSLPLTLIPLGIFVIMFGSIASWLGAQSKWFSGDDTELWTALATRLLTRREAMAHEERFCPTDDQWDDIEKLPGVDYYAYLQSEAWGTRREYKLLRAGHRCQLCNARGRLEVHHRTYARLGEEQPEDLTVLCHECHELFHDHAELAERA